VALRASIPLFGKGGLTPFPVFFRAVVVAQRDAVHALAAEARGEALEETLAIERPLALARQPRGGAQRAGKEHLRAKLDRDRGRGDRQARELLAGDPEDEMRLALRGGEIERHARARLARVLEDQPDPLGARPARAKRALEFREEAAEREGERLDAFGLRRKLQARTEARRRDVRQARIRATSHEPLERVRDLRPEPAREARERQGERVAQPQDAQVREERERPFRPVEEEEGKVGEAFLERGELEAAAHRQSLRFRPREEARGERRGRDAQRRSEAQLAHAAA